MIKILREKGTILGIFLVYYYLIQIITFEWINFQFLPSSFFVDFFIALMIGSVVFLFKSNKLAIAYVTVIISMVIALFMVNATLYSVYRDIFTLQQFTLLQEAGAVFRFEFVSINSLIVTVLIAISYFLVIYVAWKKILRTNSSNFYYPKAAIIFISLNLLLVSFFFSDIETFDLYRDDNAVTAFKRTSLKKYGLFGYYFKESEFLIGGSQIDPDIDIDDDSIIPVENPGLTDYHGFLAGANVITILVETLQPFAVNEVLTPNLYKLNQEGLYFPNNYSENKTNVSEMIAITGNYPTFYFLPKTYDYDFSQSLPSVLREDNYHTGYFHDNVGSFYNREKFFEDLGFDDLYFHEDLFPDKEMWHWGGNYNLDSLTVESVIDKIETEGNFYYYWSTMITHGPYNNSSENINLFTELGYFDQIDTAENDGLWENPLSEVEEDALKIRYYQAAVMDFDKALGKLLDFLEENNILDDTILVLFGDHNVYYHDLSKKMYEESGSEYYNFEMYKTYLNIYNPLLTNKFLETNSTNVIEKFVSLYNIVPTVFELLGYEYNQNFMMAEPVFTDALEIFYSQKLTGYFNDKFYSDDGFDVIYQSADASGSDLNLFLDKTFILNNRIEMINYFYDETKKPI
ncbi:MAG: LTA synthase family protein [Candidatus Izemoplasmatales bacterium]